MSAAATAVDRYLLRVRARLQQQTRRPPLQFTCRLRRLRATARLSVSMSIGDLYSEQSQREIFQVPEKSVKGT